MTTSLLQQAYDDLSLVVRALDEASSWQPTRCAGWCVRDLVFHHLGDAQRALVALATPADGPADRTAVSYWRDAPGRDDPESRGLRATRTMASAYRLDHLVDLYSETSAAVVTASERLAPASRVATQGHVLTVASLSSTLAVEAAVHHLDLVVALDQPGPAAASVAAVREVVDELLGRPTPDEWDDTVWTLEATGRAALSAQTLVWLGADARRLPLLG